MVQTNRRRIHRIIKAMEHSLKGTLTAVILFIIIFILLIMDFDTIERKLNTIDQKLDQILQEQVMTNKYLYN